MKRFLSLLIALIVLLSLAPAALAEGPAEYQEGDTIEYAGEGEVDRGRIRRLLMLSSSLSDLKVSYLDLNRVYLVNGQSATWTLVADGGSGGYSYEFYLWYRAGTSGSLAYVTRQNKSESNVFTYTPNHASGQYMVSVNLYDSTGAYVTWQSQIYEVYSPQDADDEKTVAGKVEQLAAECVAYAGDSEYARALWLHDWLTLNANYDYSLTKFYPSGVLLDGTGVCQSYALAYDMLLKAVGMESVYVTGTAGGGSHAWNIVKIDGEWYHIDCTWDDPGEGGLEGHDYFCLSDEKMAQDHLWTSDAEKYPPCPSDEISYNRKNGYIEISGEAALKQALTAYAAKNMTYVPFLYTGSGSFDFGSAVQSWLSSSASANVSGVSWSISGNVCVVRLKINGVSTDESKAQLVSLDRNALTLTEGASYRLVSFALPEGGSGLSWTSSNEKVASVKDGLVTALIPGSATVTVRCENGNSASCAVTCTADPRKGTFGNFHYLSQDDGTVTLVGFVNPPTDGLVIPATLNGRAVSGFADGLFDGIANISTPCGTYAASYAKQKGLDWTITHTVVIDPAVEPTFTSVGLTEGSHCSVCLEIFVAQQEIPKLVAPDAVRFAQEETSGQLNIGDTLTLTPVLTPDNAVATFTWTSSAPAVASIDENGLVTALQEGSATVTVKTQNGKTATFKINVTDPYKPTGITLDKTGTVTLSLYDTLQLHSALIPDTAVSDVTWTSGASTVAAVDENGLVTPLKEGFANITAKTVKGNQTATITVIVVDPHKPTGVTLDKTGTVTLSLY